MSELTPLVVDNTAGGTFRTCPQKYFRRHIQHLTPTFTAAPLNFGACLHKGIASLLIGKSFEESCTDMLAGWQEQEPNEFEWRTPDRLVSVLTDIHTNELHKQLKISYFPPSLACPKCLHGRNLRNGKDNTKVCETCLTVAEIIPTPMVECPIGAPFECSDSVKELLPKAGHSGVIIAGVIDAVIYDGDRLVICDHKTDSGHYRSPKGGTPFVSPDVFDKFKPHGAFPIYLDLAQQYMPKDMVLSGCMVNIICLSKPTKADPLGRNLFARHIYEWTPEEIAESRQDFNKMIEEILRAKIEGFYRKNPDACTLYNRRCNYLELCKNPPATRKALESVFSVSPWDPLHALKNDSNGD